MPNASDLAANLRATIKAVEIGIDCMFVTITIALLGLQLTGRSSLTMVIITNR
jgi:hypothetical protein